MSMVRNPGFRPWRESLPEGSRVFSSRFSTPRLPSTDGWDGKKRDGGTIP